MVHSKFRVGQLILGIVLTLFAVICFVPMLLGVIASFTSQEYISTYGYSFFPNAWSLKGYEYVMDYGIQLIRSYLVTIWITVAGTAWSLAIMSMFAYTLARDCFQLRRAFSVMMLITMLFTGGRAAGYIINSQVYNLQDSLWVLILPGVSTMYVIIFRTYIQHSIPGSLIESAKIDGAGEFRIFVQIILPCMIPTLASVGYMIAVNQWNAWENALLYITSPWKTPLQLLLIRIEKNIQYLLDNAGQMSAAEYYEMVNSLPKDSTRFAIMVVCSGPILIAYPFFQKYFIQGITMGSVKG